PRSLQAPNRIRLTGGLERGGAPERGLLLLVSPCFESVVSRQITAGLSTTKPRHVAPTPDGREPALLARLLSIRETRSEDGRQPRNRGIDPRDASHTTPARGA